ncbi:MAG TPA: hypothetical protein EYP61_07995, partial [Candidatus Latescibacteria bacterium]|nr:hypothetical protein [Candidatus Latescibacterota bacterium]
MRDLSLIVVVGVVLWGSQAWGKIYRYRIGGKGGVPWEDLATVIQSYEKGKPTIELKESETKLVSYTRFPGSLEPLWTDSTINLARTIYDRGGRCYTGWGFDDLTPIDGKAKALDNTYVMKAPHYAMRSVRIRMDLGGQFWIASVRFYTRILREGPDPSKFPKGYIFSSNYMQKYGLFINDGTEIKAAHYIGDPLIVGTLLRRTTLPLGWKLVAKTDENRQSYVRIDLDPPRLAKYLWL